MSEDEEFRERMRLLRDHVAAEEIDEIVRWQMTGLLTKKAPTVAAAQPLPTRCRWCRGDWHGLPNEDGCPGSFDTPE